MDENILLLSILHHVALKTFLCLQYIELSEMDWEATYSSVMELPSYKLIVKHVLSKHIQRLLEEMSSETSDEWLILTVNPHNGTVSHHGSQTGKAFLQNRDDLKTQFLRFCMKGSSQIHPSNNGQCQEPSVSRKRKSIINESPDSAKLQKKSKSKVTDVSSTHRKAAETLGASWSTETLTSQGTSSYKHPYTLRRTGRSKIGTSVLRNSTSSQNSSKKSPSIQDLPNSLTTCRTLPEVESTNQNFLLHAPNSLPQHPQFTSSVDVTEGVTSAPGIVSRITQVDHPYLIDSQGDKTSELNGGTCRSNDHNTSTIDYSASNINNSEQLIQDRFDIKGEEVEREAGCCVPYSGLGCEIIVNTLDSAGIQEQEDSNSGAVKAVEETQSSASIQFNGIDINFRIPELQPIVQLETFNPIEKQITNNRDRISQSTPRTSGLSEHIEVKCQKLFDTSNAAQGNTDSSDNLETLDKAIIVATDIGVDIIKEEPLVESDNPRRSSDNSSSTSKQERQKSRLQKSMATELTTTYNQHSYSLFSLKDFIVMDVKLEGDPRNQDIGNPENKKIKENDGTSMETPFRSKESECSHTDAEDEDNILEDCSSCVDNETIDQGLKDSKNIEIKNSQNQQNSNPKKQQILDSVNQQTLGSQNQQIQAFQSSQNQEIYESQNQEIKDTKSHNTKIKESSLRDSQQSCIENSQPGSTGVGASLEEIDDTIEDIDILASLDSDLEWNQTDNYEDASSDESDDESIIEDVENSELVKREVTKKLDQLSDKYIFDENGDLLGRNLEDSKKVKCVTNKDIYLKKIIKGNHNSKSQRFFDLVYVCVYCKKMYNKIWRHFKRSHKNEPLVLEVLDLEISRDLNDDRLIKEKIDKLIAMKQLLLRNKGNYEHNMRVMRKKKGEIFLSRRRKDYFDSELFGHCPECLEWLNLKQGYPRHKANCVVKNKTSTSDTLVQNLVIQGKILASTSQEMKNEVFPQMPNDRLTKTAKYDPLICALGEYHLTNRHGGIERRGLHACYRMRVAARLLHFFWKEIKLDYFSMSDCLRVEHFDLVAKCAMLAASKNSQKEYQHTVFSKRLGYDLLTLISAKIGGLKRDRRDKELEDAKKFHSLLQEQWKEAFEAKIIILNEERKAFQENEGERRCETVGVNIEKQNHKDISPKKQGYEEMSISVKKDERLYSNSFESQSEQGPLQNKLILKEKLPEKNETQKNVSEQLQAGSNETGNCIGKELDSRTECDPEDFVRLAEYFREELQKLSVPDDVCTPEKHRYLVTLCLACMVLYNSCDADKIQFLTVEAYKRKLRCKEQANRNLYGSITDLERELLKTQDRIELKHTGTKRRVENERLYGNHRVPIILPPGMVNLLNHLADPMVRQTCFVESGNHHLFATFDSELEPLSLQSALDTVTENAELNKPSEITVKNLKKNTSTIFQVTNLPEERLLQFVQDIGLIEKLNLEEGQSISGLEVRLEIVKLIFLQEQGKTEKLRTLQEISFDEIEGERETKDTATVCDFISDEEEEDIGDCFPKKQRKKKSHSKGAPIRVPWSKVENEEIHKYFKHYITLQSRRAYPGMNEIHTVCEKSKQTHGEIWKRDWIAIKSKVASMMKKSKKKLHSDREESDNL